MDRHYSEKIFIEYLAARGIPPPKPSKTPFQRISGFFGFEVKGKEA